ncbi:hypothetical protein M1615_04125 [Patescibacteria group bacterium]|nr:hypothetical protein [Patescibacteria group bacterium]MCL5010580.1 hypothetical protein [Patescibacteria group bacterium]
MLKAKANIIKGLILIAIGLISIIVVFGRMPVSKIFIDGYKVESSFYSVDAYNSSGSRIFSLSPLDDYYYSGKAKEHLEDKLVASGNGNFLSQAVLSFTNLFFGKTKLIWNTKGRNSKGFSTVTYSINSIGKGIRITREIRLEHVSPTAIGQSVVICSDCMVTDNRNRIYFNGDSLNDYLINAAFLLKKTPMILGENQSFPNDISKIRIIGRDGKEKMEIPVVSGEAIYLQEKWHLLEFRVGAGKQAVSQTIYIKR